MHGKNKGVKMMLGLTCRKCEKKIPILDGSKKKKGIYIVGLGFVCQECREFEKVYNLLMDYWEYIPEDDRQKLHKELEEILTNREVRKGGL